MSIEAGVRLGPYEVTGLLGAGGMGEVYRARDTRLDRDVAIKILPASFGADPQLLERFEREAKTISQLNHPSICTLHDVGSSGEIHYLVMELIEGESLADRLKRGPLPLEDVLRHGSAIADALDAAHKRGITHRDLKPGNVMLTKSGAKLLDFGLAKTAGEGRAPIDGLTNLPTEAKPLTKEGTILGTFQYMAPEQLEGLEADARTDIFALGAVLYEMATARRAFEGKSKTSLIAAIVSGQPQAISSVTPMAPPALDHVVNRCLEKDPDDRWQSAHDVAAELRWISTAGSQAGVAAPRVKRRRRREGLAWIIAAILGLAMIGMGLWGWNRKPADLQPVWVSIPAPSGSTVSGPAVSPDGRSVAYSIWKDGKGQLYLRSFAEREANAVDGAANAINPFFSPDGKWIAYFADHALRKISVEGGSPISICAINRLEGGTWGTDGSIVFSEGPPHGLFRVPALGGEPTEITKVNVRPGSDRQDAHMYPSFLPGEGSILFAIWSAGSQPEYRVAVADLATGKTRALFGGRQPLYSPAGRILYFSPTDERTLIAAPFDPGSLEVKGEPAIVATDAMSAGLGGGTLAYRSQVNPQSRLEWITTTGSRTLIPMEPKQIDTVAISPDGKRAALSIWKGGDNYDIWIADLGRGTASPVTSYAGWDRFPVWSPDGKSIVFGSDRGGPPNLYRVSPDGGTPERLTNDFAIEAPWCFTPDGRRLIFSKIALAKGGVGWGKADLETLDLASHEVAPLLASDAGETSAALSPDGAWLAYVSDESGHDELYLRSFPDLAGKTRVSTDGVQGHALWSHDGRTLYYVNRERKFVAVSIGHDGALGEPRTLFDAHLIDGADIARDGRLLAAEAEGETREGIVASLNWTKILGRK